MADNFNNGGSNGNGHQRRGGNGDGHDGNGWAVDSLLKVTEVAKLLRVHPNTVRSWTSLGVLPCYRVGPRKDRRIPADAVKTLLEIGPG